MSSYGQLGIVIPAYKDSFLQQTLESLRIQTNRNFTLFIGDDCSPFGLEKIIEPYKKELPIVYRRFENNLGKTSLVQHWNRCLNLVPDHIDWIWLFSDDDLMDKGCVGAFYDFLQSDEYQWFKPAVLRYNLIIIDENDQVLSRINYPDLESGRDFIRHRFAFSYDSAITGYIFNRQDLIREGLFEDLPLAWGSDDATIVKVAGSNGIYTFRSSDFVYWRMSGLNLSSDLRADIGKEKLKARIIYLKWLRGNRLAPDGKLQESWLQHSYEIESQSLSLKDKFSIAFFSLGRTGLRIFSQLVLWTLSQQVLSFKKRVKRILRLYA